MQWFRALEQEYNISCIVAEGVSKQEWEDVTHLELYRILKYEFDSLIINILFK
jgi:hypothetical protein